MLLNHLLLLTLQFRAPPLHSPPLRACADTKIRVEADEASVGVALCEMLVAEYERAVAARGTFSFAISGGSMLKMLSNLRADDRRVDWSKCTMGFVSHRCLPLDADGSTTAKAKPAFLDAWTDAGLTVLNLGGTTDAEAEAAAYEAALGRPITTEVAAASDYDQLFYYGENYHQQYLAKPGARPYCSAQPRCVSLPPFESWCPPGLEHHKPKLPEAFWKEHGPKPHCVIRSPNPPIVFP